MGRRRGAAFGVCGSGCPRFAADEASPNRVSQRVFRERVAKIVLDAYPQCGYRGGFGSATHDDDDRQPAIELAKMREHGDPFIVNRAESRDNDRRTQAL